MSKKMNQLEKERMQIILVNLATLILFIICLILKGIYNIWSYVILVSLIIAKELKTIKKIIKKKKIILNRLKGDEKFLIY